jgi:hypothetical protein
MSQPLRIDPVHGVPPVEACASVARVGPHAEDPHPRGHGKPAQDAAPDAAPGDADEQQVPEGMPHRLDVVA